MEEIVAAASELNINLIIIPTHGYSGLKHALRGSIAERVLQAAPCPVCTIRKDRLLRREMWAPFRRSHGRTSLFRWIFRNARGTRCDSPVPSRG